MHAQTGEAPAVEGRRGFSVAGLAWAADGAVWAQFDVAPEIAEDSVGDLVTSLAGLGIRSRFVARPDGGRLMVEVVGGPTLGVRAVLRAGIVCMLDRFGLGLPLVPPSTRGIWEAAAEALGARLAALGVGKVSLVPLGDPPAGPPWREVRASGYLVTGRDDACRYRACLVAVPAVPGTVDWEMGRLAERAIWVRPSRRGPSAAVVVDVVRTDLVSLSDAVAHATRALHSSGWDVARPEVGQHVLAAAMSAQLPDPWPPTSIFFPLPCRAGR